MAGLAAGLATFASCNKAGSIPHFTQHLSRFPNDYVALIWRSRAHGIVGNTSECRMDLVQAITVSSGAQKQVAQAHLERLDGNIDRYVSLLQSTTRDFPRYSPAWSDLGSYFQATKEYEKALVLLQKAVEVAKANFETGSPWFCWDNHSLGEIYLSQVGDVDKAEEYFRAAIESCGTLTVAHMGLCQVHLARNKISEARQCFDKAKQLNPKLIHWGSFEAFREEFATSIRRQREQQDSLDESVAQLSLQKGQQGSRDARKTKESSASSGGRKGRGGNDGGGSDSSDGNDDDNNPDPWQKLKKESPCVAKIGKRQYAQSKDGKYWYSKDTAGHGTDRQHKDGGGSYLKRYRDRGRTIDFDCAVDRNLRKIEGKHESQQGTSINKNEMNIIKRK